MMSKVIVAIAALAIPTNALWPVPTNITTGTSALFIDQNVKITYNGAQLTYTHGYEPPAGTKFNSKDIVQGGVSRAFKNIFNANFVPWMLRPRNSNFEPGLGASKKRVKTITIKQTGKDTAQSFKPRAGDVDESYSLTLSADGDVNIQAKSAAGILYALETFSQLFFKHSSGTFFYTTQAPVAIQDSPKYPHRGVMLDLARSYLSVDTIKKTIDAMAWNKLNRLHLHITDSQSWPLVIPSMPKLSELGAYHPSLTYSPSDIASIYEYGVHRGVEVIMEIDMPGHIGVVSLAYKDLIVAYEQMPYQQFCAEPPCGAFSMNNTKVYDFVNKLFDDLLPRISPYSSYFHTGGDELNTDDSTLDPGVGTNSTAVIAPLLQKFLNVAHGKIRAAGMSPLVWEEMVTTWNQTLSNDTVVQSWLGDGAVKKLAESGHRVIDSDYNFYYLDCGRGQWVNFPPGNSYNVFSPFNDWCGPAKNWRMMYAHDPAAGVAPSAVKNVLGGEVAVWSELIDVTNLESLVWPRASAAGEVWWSGNTDASGALRSQLETTPRLAELRERMVARGVGASPVQMMYCTQNNATACALLMP